MGCPETEVYHSLTSFIPVLAVLRGESQGSWEPQILRSQRVLPLRSGKLSHSTVNFENALLKGSVPSWPSGSPGVFRGAPWAPQVSKMVLQGAKRCLKVPSRHLKSPFWAHQVSVASSQPATHIFTHPVDGELPVYNPSPSSVDEEMLVYSCQQSASHSSATQQVSRPAGQQAST